MRTLTGHIQARLRPHALAVLPGLITVALMLIWAVHNGGYDRETWYWGALATLGILAATTASLGRGGLRVSRASVIAIGLLGLYTVWSYVSIAWAQAPGDALAGSNKTLLYFLVFALLVLLPWTPRGALVALLAFVLGVGVIGIVLLFRLAAHDHVETLVIEGRLAAPTGYFNSTAALFMIDALAATVLASRRELPGILRGLLAAFACSGLQLALIVQSRGWLFTLPLVGLATILIAPDRLRLVATAVLPSAGALVIIRRLLDVYQSGHGAALAHASARAGQAGLQIFVAVFMLGTLTMWYDGLIRRPRLSRARRRMVGAAVSSAAVVGACASFAVLTHGDPFGFISRQWNGFSQIQRSFSHASHFGDVGSGRYDFWRAALDAVLAHPIGGLGQDNFADYYLLHRRTSQETSAVHSLELRLVAHTGLVGFALFAAFMVAALRLAVRARTRTAVLTQAVAGAALMPLVVWLIYGSVDWFWEFPALSGPALGFLAVAGALTATEAAPVEANAAARAVPAGLVRRPEAALAGGLALIAAVIVLGVPYLSVREISVASNMRFVDPAAALRDLRVAARLNPLDSLPGRMAGAIALQNAKYMVAKQRFDESISRERDGWFSWLGAGLAASALGHPQTAHADFVAAYRLNSHQPAVRQALARVYSRAPLTSAEAFKLLVLA